MKRLTVALPDDVWDRLAAEAAEQDVKIGTLARRLIVARDERKNRDRSVPSNRK